MFFFFIWILFIVHVILGIVSIAVPSSLLIFPSTMSNLLSAISDVFFISVMLFISRSSILAFKYFPYLYLLFEHMKYSYNDCFKYFLMLILTSVSVQGQFQWVDNSPNKGHVTLLPYISGNHWSNIINFTLNFILGYSCLKAVWSSQVLLL